MVLVDAERPREPRIFIRGNAGNRGPEVPRRFLRLLEGDDRVPFALGSGRLELARKIVDPENPLTARVMVNRIWMHHFGRPIVGTPSDFGTRSDPPTHPELLDDLANRFGRGRLVDQGDASPDHEFQHLPPGQPRAARMRGGRPRESPPLDAESPSAGVGTDARRHARRRRPVRRAPRRPAGRPCPPTLPGRVGRSYSTIDRTFLDGVYRTFDFASTDATAADRPSTTVPQQALFLMNSEFAAEQARSLARRGASDEGSTDPTARIDRLYRLLFGRSPDGGELELGVAFLESQAARTEAPADPWINGYGGHRRGHDRRHLQALSPMGGRCLALRRGGPALGLRRP